MTDRTKVRRQIACEAARLIFFDHEGHLGRAKQLAARRLLGQQFSSADLPTDVEVRDELEALAALGRPPEPAEKLRQMRLWTLQLMRRLGPFCPRLVGRVLAGDVGPESRVSLLLFSDDVEAVAQVLNRKHWPFIAQRVESWQLPEADRVTRFEVQAPFPLELTVLPAGPRGRALAARLGATMADRASIAEVETLLAREYPTEVVRRMAPAAHSLDRFAVYRSLLLPLEDVQQDRQRHPEGDALYHSLQVFALGRQAQPYDEEFLLAALLHDVGKAIDPQDHVAAGLDALEGFITPRTAWFIEQHPAAQQELEGTLGVRARRRLRQSPDFDLLLELARCDRMGRQRGALVPDVDEALAYVRDLADACEGEWDSA
jgi:hypothetical protein